MLAGGPIGDCNVILDGEHCMMRALNENNIECPLPVLNVDGAEKSLEKFDDGTYVRHSLHWLLSSERTLKNFERFYDKDWVNLKALRECICPPNEFFTAFIEGWEGDGALLKPSLYLEPFSKYQALTILGSRP